MLLLTRPFEPGTLCGFIGMAIARSVFEDAAFYGFVVGFIATRTAFEPLAAASTAAREATDEENWLPSIVQNHVEVRLSYQGLACVGKVLTTASWCAVVLCLHEGTEQGAAAQCHPTSARCTR